MARRKSHKPEETRTRWQTAFLSFVVAATLAVCILVGGKYWKIGIAGEWQWEYYKASIAWLNAAPAILMSLVLGAVIIFWLRRRLSRPLHEVVALAVCLALALGIILDIGKSGPSGEYEAVPVTASPWIGGYFGEAVWVKDMGTYLDQYTERISGLEVNEPYGHLADHPAGPVLFHWLVNRTMEALPSLARRFIPRDPEAYGRLRAMVESRPLVGRKLSDGEFAGIWAAAFLFRIGYWLALLPLYLITREMYSKEAGLLAVVLAALIPSLHLFGPYPDQLFPVIALAAFYTWMRAIKRRSIIWAAVSACLLSIGLFWSMAFLALIALLGMAALLMAWKELLTLDSGKVAAGAGHAGTLSRSRWQAFAWCGWIRVCAGWTAAMAACALLPILFFGYDVIGVWRICLSQHANFAVLFPRSYVQWTLFNPLEFALFTGIPAFLLMLLAAVMDARRWRREWGGVAPAVLPWALLSVLVVLNFSGKNLGEVSRLWMFLMPFAAVSAGATLYDLDRGRGWVAACILLTTMIQLVVFRLSLDVMGILVNTA